MPSRTITKMLAGIEDLLFGRGVQTQARAGGNYQISKISVPLVVETVDELADLDASKFPFVAVSTASGELSFYEYATGTGYKAVSLVNPLKRDRASFRLVSATNTSIITAGVATKLLAVTEPGANNYGFSHTNGRLVFDSTEAQLAAVDAGICISATNTARLAFYIAINGVPVDESRYVVEETATAVPRTASLHAVVQLPAGCDVEVYVANLDDVSDVKATAYHLSVST